jgi:sugar lactone lactonase YvrE
MRPGPALLLRVDGVCRPVIEIDPALGAPDGLTVDADGAIWVALWGGAAVHRYLTDGSLDTVVRLDVPQPSACAFGGADLGTLFVTTSRSELERAPAGSGALYAVRPGMVGRPPDCFAG